MSNAIGLSGLARSGKTTAAEYIERRYGFQRFHIAEPLRDMLRTLLRNFGMHESRIEAYLTGELKEDKIHCLGVTSRHAQISLGTEWGREQIDDDLWVRAWTAMTEGVPRKMNDSVRFLNEQEGIREMGGFNILIEREGTKPAAYSGPIGKFLYEKFGLWWGVHPSERIDRLDPDYFVHNDGTIEDLYERIDEIMYRRGIDPID